METMFGNVFLLLFVVVQIIIGARLDNLKKPYNVSVLIVHIILSLFIILGLSSGIYVYLTGMVIGTMFSSIALYTAGLSLLVNIVTGLSLLSLKDDNPKLALVHKMSAYAIAVFLIAHIIFLAVKI